MNGGIAKGGSWCGPRELTKRTDRFGKSWMAVAGVLLADMHLRRCRCILLEPTQNRPLWTADTDKGVRATEFATPCTIAHLRSSRSTVIQTSQKRARHASPSLRAAIDELRRSPFDAAVSVRCSNTQIAVVLIASKTNRLTAASLRAVKNAAQLLANAICAPEGSERSQSHDWLLTPAVRTLAHDLQNLLVPGATLLRVDAKTQTGPEQNLASLALSDLQIVQRFFQMLVAAADTLAFGPFRTSARAILDSATDKVRAAGMAKNVSIRVDSDTSELFVDPNLCSALLEQLLRNAIESTPNGTTVSVTARQIIQGGMVRFEVRDRGQGVSARLGTNLFSPFTTTKRIRDGHFGLGLAIARDIARLHDGQLSFVNHTDGGASFYFDIRARMESPADATRANLPGQVRRAP